MIVIAPDKFKGTLSAAEAAAAMADGVHDVAPAARVRLLPMADGGEGTLDVLAAAGGERVTASAHDALGAPVTVLWLRRGDAAFVESAAVIGLQAVADPDADTAWRASSAGVGEVLLAAMDAGCTRVVLTLGGVATTDAGAGALLALGARFTDAGGRELREVTDLDAVAAVDLTGLDPRLGEVRIEAATDVVGPLSGPDGAAHVFGPQKGADAATVRRLDARLAAIASALAAATGADPATLSGAAAAGGIAVGLGAVADLEVSSGFDVVAQAVGLEAALAVADLVLVGEGSLDAQSLTGKAPVAVARAAAAAGVPVLAIAGVVRVDADELRRAGILGAVSVLEACGGDVERAVAHPADGVRRATAALVERELSRPGSAVPRTLGRG